MRFLPLLISIFLISPCAQAKDVWIHAIGIDENIHSQNYADFYRSGEDFETACAQSDQHPDCHLFLNADKANVPDGADVSLDFKKNEGAPNAQNLKLFIQQTLAKAGKGDTVVISLDDHGGPVAGKSPSCIWLASNNYICEDDLKEILKNKPPGVKVLVSADGCFSGGFMNLATKETCVATASSRLDFGTLVTHGLWNAVKSRHIKTLADIKEPIFNESGAELLLTSQMATAQRCKVLRDKMGPKAVSNLSFVLSFKALSRGGQCSDSTYNGFQISELTNEVMNALSDFGGKSCQDLGLPPTVCEARDRLSKADPELRTEAANLLKIETERTNTFNDFLDITKTIATKMKGLSAEEIKELGDSIAISSSPDWSKFASNRVNLAQQLWGNYQTLMVKLGDSQKAGQPELEKIKNDGLYNDLLTVQSCLFESAIKTPESYKDPAQTEGLRYFRKVESGFPERQFSKQDIEEANQCESSIRF